MAVAEIVTALATGVSAIALCWGVYYQYEEKHKPRVFLYRFKAEPFWFLVVKCVRDPIQDCTAFLDSKNLIIKGTDRTPIYARPLALNDSILFGISQSDTTDISEGTIAVKDGRKTLRKMKFKDIPVHDPNEGITVS